MNAAKPKQKPILLKIAPDLTDSKLLDIIDIVKETDIAGVIATNTTIFSKKVLALLPGTNVAGNQNLSKPALQR